MANQPAHTVYDGALKLTIWRNISDKGPWYSIVPSRSYKQGDETWRETDNLNQDDLLPLAELTQAYAWIKMQKRADSKARKNKEKEAEPAAA